MSLRRPLGLAALGSRDRLQGLLHPRPVPLHCPRASVPTQLKSRSTESQARRAEGQVESRTFLEYQYLREQGCRLTSATGGGG